MKTDGFAQKVPRRFTIPLGCQQEAPVAPALLTMRYKDFHAPCPSHRSYPVASCRPRGACVPGKSAPEPAQVKRGMINLHTMFARYFLDLAIADGYATYRRTPHRMISRSKWFPLNSI
jgi:hypothetical protein